MKRCDVPGHVREKRAKGRTVCRTCERNRQLGIPTVPVYPLNWPAPQL